MSCSTAIVVWARLLTQVLAAIATYDEKIDELARTHPDYALMKSFPGAGPALAPRLIAAMGSRRDRYEGAHELQCYSGIAPVVASSGQKRSVHWRWARPKFLRQTFHEWALHSIAYSQWRDSTTSSSEPRENAATPRSASSRSNGSASCFAAGRSASRR